MLCHHTTGIMALPMGTCGELQTIQHLLECAQLDEKCIIEDIHVTNNVALDTAMYWAENI